jgi:hypothetical protein
MSDCNSTPTSIATSSTIGSVVHDEDTIHTMVEWELNKRRGRSATYTQPLISEHSTACFEEQEDIATFLTEFYGYQIFDYMNDMKLTLQQYSDTVAIHYGLLVPNLCSFDEFWSRYYFRCSYTQTKKEILQKLQSEASSIQSSNDKSNVATTTAASVSTVCPKQLSESKDSTSSVNRINKPIDQDGRTGHGTSSSTENDTSNSLLEIGLIERMKLQQEQQQQRQPQTQPPPTGTLATKTTSSVQRRTQMFCQEYDRDIIEIIPEEVDEEIQPSSNNNRNSRNSCSDDEYENVGLMDDDSERYGSTTDATSTIAQHIANGF